MAVFNSVIVLWVFGFLTVSSAVDQRLLFDSPVSVDPTGRLARQWPPKRTDELSPLQEVDETYRLPKTSVPTHYNLHIRSEIHSGNRAFSGSVEIHLTVIEATNAIIIHHRGLTIESSTLASVPATGNPVPLANPTVSYDSRVEHLIFTSTETLIPGNFLLTVTFSGTLTNNDDGFYISSYVNDAGITRFLATTMFAPTSARMAFPCYDEPGLKATFTIWITHHNSYNARSNMRFSVESLAAPDSEYAVTKFDQTPILSTYLLAFVVSDFVAKGTSEMHKVYARPNAIDEVDFAVEAGDKIIAALNSHLEINYFTYMPEMKQFAIPDFAASAMENWGLVTYREHVLLYNPSLSDFVTKKSVATVVAHEFAHQWFGNLVTAEWWEYIWLNEGFATLYQYYAAHMAYPDQEYWELYNTEVIQDVMVPDGLVTTRPMTWNADSPPKIRALFDRVAYPKSGSVLNMLRHVLGEENWAAGLRTYLEARKLQSANADHLYAGLQAAIANRNVLPEGVTVKQIMDTWANEPGYPVLSVRRTYETGDVIISQERFISDRKVSNTNMWMIPYNFVRQSMADFNDLYNYEWLSTKATRISTQIPANEWIIFNKQQVGFYRVNYDNHNWELIINALKANWASVHRLNRAQLIDDAHWLARSNRLDLEILMKLLTYLENEMEYAPWTAASSVLSYFNGKLRGTPDYPHFLTVVNKLIDKVYATLQITTVSDTETLLHKYLKQTISTWACIVDHKDCLQLTKEALTNEAVNEVMVNPDVASVVYCYGLREAGETEYRYLYQRIYRTQNWAYRLSIIDALGCSLNKEFLKAFLLTAVSPNGAGVEINYKAAERERIVQSVYFGSRVGVDALIEFLMDPKMIDEFIARIGTDALNNAIRNIAFQTNSLGELDKLNQLLVSLGSRLTDEAINAARATAQKNLDWQGSSEGLLTSELVAEYAAAIEQGTTTVDPGVTTEVPVTTTNQPVTTTKNPSTTTKLPDTTTESLATTTDSSGKSTTPASQTTIIGVSTTTEDDGATTTAVSFVLLTISTFVTLFN
ncbi:aminopeptidase N-like [Uranotaenia lowii]|uniref:aminopeptidase N-like n=1 Tax=Uranotaenia lowii TaxID=190385 RepID=UPI00247A4E2C|nr:aminopeptidase N-like [Uranotaenia lowii]